MLREPKIQERYLCGPRLEAQCSGRAEFAVEGCRPGWLSQEHEWKHCCDSSGHKCAKLALPDMGSHLQAFFHKLKRKKYEPMASWVHDTETNYTKVKRASARLQRPESTEESELQRSYFSPQGGQVCHLARASLGRVMEWDGCSDAGSNAWSRWNWST